MIPNSMLFIFPVISFSMLFPTWVFLQIKLIEYLAKTKIELEQTTPMFWVSSIVTPIVVVFWAYKDVLN